MDKQTPLSAEEEHRYWRHHFDSRLNRIDDRIDELNTTIKDAVVDMKQATTAGFPNGDASAHKQVHEGYIKKAEQVQKIKNEVITHTLKGIVWAVVVFIAISVWNYVTSQVHK